MELPGSAKVANEDEATIAKVANEDEATIAKIVHADVVKDVETLEVMPQANVENIRYSPGLFAAIRRGLSIDMHRDILILNASLLGLLSLLLLCSLSEYHLAYLMVGLLSVLPLFYVLYRYFNNCLSSETLACLSNHRNAVNFHHYVQRMREAEPDIFELAHCYHYEVQHYYSLYDRFVRKDYRDLVTTHWDAVHMNYSSITDASVIPDPSLFSICKVTCTKQYIPTDATKALYYEKKETLFGKHQYCDDERKFSADIKLPGYRAKFFVYGSEGDMPYIVRHGEFFFWLCTIIPINWLFRVYITGICGHVKVEVKKVVDIVR